MKNASKRQYILTLIVSFVAIVVLSLCTIMTFYKKSVNDTLGDYLISFAYFANSRSF